MGPFSSIYCPLPRLPTGDNAWKAGAVKEIFNDVVNDGKGNLGTEMGLNSEYSLGKWEFVTKERGGGQWMKN